MARKVSDRKSVKRSAKIIEAVFEIGSLKISFNKNDLRISPAFPGEALIDNPEKKIFNDRLSGILIPSKRK